MTIKVFFENRIHKIGKLPANFKELIYTITSLFETHLPQSWKLQYIDSKENTIMLSHEEDYQNLLKDKSTSCKKTIKMDIVPLLQDQQHIHQSNLKGSEEDKLRLEEGEANQYNQEDEQNGSESSQSQDSDASEEEDVSSEDDLRMEGVEEIISYQDRTAQGKSQGKDKRQRSDQRAMKLFRKLAKSEYSEAKSKLQVKLRELEKGLKPEEKEDFARKKEYHLNHSCVHNKMKRRHNTKNKNPTLETDIPTTKEDIIQQSTVPEESQTVQEQKQRENKVDAGDVAIHEGVFCNGCSKSSFSGIRYKCSICPDFDYCETCEATLYHPHPFIQMIKPGHIGPSSLCGKTTKQTNQRKGPFHKASENLLNVEESEGADNMIEV